MPNDKRKHRDETNDGTLQSQGQSCRRAPENERYVTSVFEQLKREQPAGLRYVTFKLEDGVSFMHIVSHEPVDGSNPLVALSAFKTFTVEVRDRCVEPPITTNWHEVGSYGVFGT